MFMYRYTPFLFKAMYFDLDCFSYLIDLFEILKPTIRELLEYGKLRKRIDYTTPTILFPFRKPADDDLLDLKENLLHYLAGKQDITKLECLSNCSFVDQLLNRSSYGFPSRPLSIAIAHDMITMAEKMVELGAYIDHIDCVDRGGSPIGHAVIRGHVTLVKKMLETGISYNFFMC